MVPCRLVLIVVRLRKFALICVNDPSKPLYRLKFAGARESPWRAMRRHLTLGLDMCLGIPMQVLSTEGFIARCSAKGVEREVSLFLMQDQSVVPGEFVVVHVGYALQKITSQEARSAWEIYDRMLAAGGDESHA